MLSKLVLLILLHVVQAACMENRLRIIHTNDIHSHYDQSNLSGKDCTAEQVESKLCYGGLARLKTAVDMLRAECKNNSVLDAGDQFQGTLFYGYYRGNLTWDAMNLLSYDAMTIGNHEFDNGADNFARVAQHFKFPLVSSNIVAARHPTLSNLVKSYILFPDKKVALIGYVTPNLPAISHVGPLLDILDTAPALQDVIDLVRSLGYTNVIALSHKGYKNDIELVSKIHGLSLIVGGHSHSYLAPKGREVNYALPSQGLYPTPVQDKNNRTTYIVQAIAGCASWAILTLNLARMAT
ncbi:hypothetical protein DSO57_1006638 [Entomophthora muscae]|uniref:Uncharacterized protein n=1 Tax=Entomophthora muscae TaxID=34485 RepID=A0ACC2U595_9FUNG|nr:hypothetical protein DSO57_1006638 [Entomophthora muscae]